MAGKQFLAIEVVKMYQIVNLIPKVETKNIPQQIGHLYEKEKEGGRKGNIKEAAFKVCGLCHRKNGVAIDCYEEGFK